MTAGNGAALLTIPDMGRRVGTVFITQPIGLPLGSPVWLNLQVALHTVGPRSMSYIGATTVGAATRTIS